ncbi:MAG: PTS system glucose-specific IIC component [Flavobacteriales bacterium]
MMVSAALTSFLTGITEPIEFAFMFVAPVLYLLHAIMASAAFVFCIEWGVKHGTTFSHGFIDYVVLFSQSSRAGWLFVIGPLWAVLYYVVFRIAIAKFNLKTPGREIEAKATGNGAVVEGDEKSRALILAFGGRSNIDTLDACITRLRVGVKNIAAADQNRLKELGAAGVLVIGNNLQAIFGPASENLKTDMEIYLQTAGDDAELSDAAPVTTASNAIVAQAPKEALAEDEIAKVNSLVASLGGAANIKRVDAFAETRLRLELTNSASIDEAALSSAGVDGILKLAGDTIHLIVGLKADQFADEMGTKLA